MGGWISTIVSAIAVYLFWRSGSSMLLIASIANFAVNFWSFGIMHNFYYHAHQITKQRNANLRANTELEGRMNEKMKVVLNRIDTMPDYKAIAHVPDWITSINMVTALIGVMLAVVAMIKIF